MSIEVRGIAPLLQVFDMPASIAFYCGVLGFEVVSTSRHGPIFDWALLRLNGIELTLNTAYESTSARWLPIRCESRRTTTRACTSVARM